jgi:hypothetical protein
MMNLPDFRKGMARGSMTMIASSPEQFNEFLPREANRNDRVIQLGCEAPAGGAWRHISRK